MKFVKTCRGVSGRLAGWAIADPDFGRIGGAAWQQRRASLLLAHPVLGSHLRPCRAEFWDEHFKFRQFWGSCFGNSEKDEFFCSIFVRMIEQKNPLIKLP